MNPRCKPDTLASCIRYSYYSFRHRILGIRLGLFSPSLTSTDPSASSLPVWCTTRFTIYHVLHCRTYRSQCIFLTAVSTPPLYFYLSLL
jgi:hypothetical protein